MSTLGVILIAIVGAWIGFACGVGTMILLGAASDSEEQHLEALELRGSDFNGWTMSAEAAALMPDRRERDRRMSCKDMRDEVERIERRQAERRQSVKARRCARCDLLARCFEFGQDPENDGKCLREGEGHADDDSARG